MQGTPFLNRRQFVALGTTLGASAVASQSLAANVLATKSASESASVPQVWRGGISAAAQTDTEITKLYHQFFHDLAAENLMDLSATPRPGAYKESFGWYFKNNTVQFGLIPSYVLRFDGEIGEFAASSGEQFFDRIESQRQRWHALAAKLGYFPIIFTEGGGTAHLQRKGLRLGAGHRVLAHGEEMSSLRGKGFKLIEAFSMMDLERFLVGGVADATSSMPWAQARALTSKLEQSGFDLAGWEWISGSKTFPENHYQLIFKLEAWNALSQESRATVVRLAEAIRVKARSGRLNDAPGVLAAKMTCRSIA